MREGEANFEEVLAFGRDAMRTEALAIEIAADRLDDRFYRVVQMIDNCRGKVVTTGVGKSGIVARKIASTLTSIGCPSLFLHPSEAMHGDLGIVGNGDVVLALSNSGESEELIAILPALLDRNIELVAILGNQDSTLARSASVVLDATIEREVCPLNLAPTTSAVVALAIGDALAMTIEKVRNVQREDYARNHPGGRLGRRLLLRVSDVMRQGQGAIPSVDPTSSFQDILCEVTGKHVGVACVVDTDGHLLGIIAESELRRALQNHGAHALELSAKELMNAHPLVLFSPDMLAYDAFVQMEDRPRPISVVPVLNEASVLVGIVHIHDLVRARL